MHHVMRLGRRIGIAIAGGVVTAVGVALLVLPGPGIGFILLGLGILSLEFEQPRVWIAQLKARGVKLKQKIAARRADHTRPWGSFARLKAWGANLRQKFAARRRDHTRH